MKLENFDTVSEKKENASKWQSLLLLMQRPWFSRRWVVQEVALARAATIYCGRDKIPWENFAVAVELFVEVETATHRLSEVMRKDERFGHVPQWFEHVSELGASVLVEATGKIFRRDGTRTVDAGESAGSRAARHRHHPRPRARSMNQAEAQNSSGAPNSSDRTLQRPLLSLEYLVSSLTVFDASQPRDAVYSLLAISRDTAPFAEMLTVSQDGSEEAIIMSTVSSFLERKPFKVDYSRPYNDICKDFISFCIRVSGKSDPSRALDILCRPWAPDSEDSFPTVPHKKPTLYKFLTEKQGREKLWERSGRTRFRAVAEYPRNDIIMKLKPEDRIGAPMLKEVDHRLKKQYWDDVMKDWQENLKDYKDSFERDVEPYLPRKPRSPKEKNADEGQGEATAKLNPGEDEEDEFVEDIDLPSWVSRMSKASFALIRLPGMHEGTRIGRQNADSLVGPPQDGHKTYSAAQNTKVDYQRLTFRKRPGLREKPGSGHYSLYTEGFILAQVGAVAEPSRLGGIPKTWTELAGWKDAMDGETEPPAEFWRTLVADRGKDHRNPPYYYATACKESVRKGGLLGGSVDTGALISKERNSIIAEFCRRVQAVIWNRRLIKTTIKTEGSPEALGLASEHVEKGDLVCILFGCTVPVILRPCEFEKPQASLEAERMQDRIESLKTVVSMCEEACFRKIRYKKRLHKEREQHPMLEKFWKREVSEELKEVNQRIQEWKVQKERAQKAKDEDDEEQKRIKTATENRLKKRKEWMEGQASSMPSFMKPKDRSSTMPTQPTTTTSPLAELDAEGFLPPHKADAGEDRTQSADQVCANGNTDRGRFRQRAPSNENSEMPEEEVQKRKEEARKKDPYMYYKLIGEAYIHGMMDGEAVRLQINEGIPKRTFEIR